MCIFSEFRCKKSNNVWLLKTDDVMTSNLLPENLNFGLNYTSSSTIPEAPFFEHWLALKQKSSSKSMQCCGDLLAARDSCFMRRIFQRVRNAMRQFFSFKASFDEEISLKNREIFSLRLPLFFILLYSMDCFGKWFWWLSFIRINSFLWYM